MSDPLRILLIGAHPADAFDNAGGTLCHHSERGDHVTSLVLTQGARIHDVVISAAMSKAERIPDADTLTALMRERTLVKRQEVIDACALMSIHDVRFLEYDDAILTVTESLVLAAAALMREIRPDVVITHWPGENGGYADQHAVTAQITLHAIHAAASVYPGDPNPPHKAAQVFFMATPGALMRNTVFSAQGGFYADVIVDISDVIDRKLRALDCLRSQAYNGAYARKRIEAADGTVGFFAQGGPAAYAEGFMRMRSETHTFLPVTERARATARLTDKERMDQYCILVAHTMPENQP